MEISGKIIAVLPMTQGEGRNGKWRSQDYVLETYDQYPRKVCFNLFNDRIDQFPMSIGDDVEVSFDINSREYNGRWYTDIRAWKVERVNAGNPATGDMLVPPPSFTSEPAAPMEDANDDLPF